MSEYGEGLEVWVQQERAAARELAELRRKVERQEAAMNQVVARIEGDILAVTPLWIIRTLQAALGDNEKP
jgi:hypothetical protein